MCEYYKEAGAPAGYTFGEVSGREGITRLFVDVYAPDGRNVACGRGVNRAEAIASAVKIAHKHALLDPDTSGDVIARTKVVECWNCDVNGQVQDEDCQGHPTGEVYTCSTCAGTKFKKVDLSIEELVEQLIQRVGRDTDRLDRVERAVFPPFDMPPATKSTEVASWLKDNLQPAYDPDATWKAMHAFICGDGAARYRQMHDRYEQLKQNCAKRSDEIMQIAGRALGYPKFCDDQKNFPGATEENGVCVGEHVDVTIVQELANRYARLMEAAEQALELVKELQKHL